MTEHIPEYTTRKGLLSDSHVVKCSCGAPILDASTREGAETRFLQHVDSETAKEQREASPEFLTDPVAIEVSDPSNHDIFSLAFGGGTITTQLVLHPDGTVTWHRLDVTGKPLYVPNAAKDGK